MKYLNENSNNFVNEFVSESDKRKPSFSRALTEWMISQCSPIPRVSNRTDLLNGKIDPVEYHYLLNPYNVKDSRLKNFPGSLRNWDIITPIWRRYLGEFMIDIRNFDVINGINNNTIKSEKEKQAGIQAMLMLIKKRMAEEGIPVETDKEFIDVESYVQKQMQGETSTDTQTIQADEILDYIIYDTKSETLYAECFSDWCTYDAVVTYRTIVNDDFKKYRIHPSEFRVLLSDERYFEDMEGCDRVFEASLSEIITNYKHVLTSPDIEYLKTLMLKNDNGQLLFNGSVFNDYISKVNQHYSDFGYSFDVSDNDSFVMNYSGRKLRCHHIQKKLPYKQKVLTYINELGADVRMNVSDDYVFGTNPMDKEITEEWDYRTYEAYLFGDSVTGVYTPYVPLICQRNELNNISRTKLSYNGKYKMFPGAPSHSIVDILVPYQILTNIYQLQRERLINKLDSFTTIPKGILEQDDLSPDEVIYNLKADGKLYLEETGSNYKNILEGIKTYIIGSSDMIIMFDKILEIIKADAWDAVDMNRQRYGDTFASDGKGVTEQAIARASVGSVPLVEFFNKFLESDYQADIDYAKLAWLSDEPIYSKGGYINKEGRVATLMVKPLDFLFSDIGVYVKNSHMEREKREAFKSFAFNLGQNGDGRLAVEAISNSSSSAKLRDVLLKAIEAQELRTQQLEEMRNNVQKEIAANQSMDKDKDRQFELEKLLRQLENDLLIAQMTLASKNVLAPNNGKIDTNAIAKLNIELERLNIERDKNNIEKDKIKSNEKIAKMNKN